MNEPGNEAGTGGLQCRTLWLALAALVLVGSGCPPPPRVQSSTDEGITGGQLVFQDDFERPELGDSWSTSSNGWRLEQGAVLGERAFNHPLWLNQALPEQVRVEFDAVALTDVGDLKFEIFANGQDHASGYVCILGGWNNTATVIARLDEHGSDRLDARQHQRVVPDRTYHITAVRTDRRLRWYVDQAPVLTYDDDAPLRGESHRFFAFNNWEVPVRFDNLRVYDLGQ